MKRKKYIKERLNKFYAERKAILVQIKVFKNCTTEHLRELDKYNKIQQRIDDLEWVLN